MTFGDFLTRSKIPIVIENDSTYKRVTIKIKHNGVSMRDEERGSKIGTKKQFILKAGQFIVSKIDARYGAFGIAPDEVDGAIITGNFWAYDVDFSKVNIEWFNQFTNSVDFYDLCERASSGITHRKYLNETSFLNNEIYLPSIDEQLRIIEEFKNNKALLNEQSEELTHQLSLVKQLRQAFLREAMQGKLMVNDELLMVNERDKELTTNHSQLTIETGAELLARIKAEKEQLIKEKKIKKQKPLPPITADEIPFEIPESWVWCRLGEICNYGSSPKAEPKDINEDTWILDLEDIEKETSKLLCKVRFKERNSLSTKSKFNIGDVLYSKLRPYLDKVIVADEDGVCTTEILPLKPYGYTNPYFFRYSLKRMDFLKYVNSVTKGMKMPRLGTKEGQLALIPFPPFSEQNRIVAKLDELMAYCDNLEESIKNSQIQNEMLLGQVLREALEPEEESLK